MHVTKLPTIGIENITPVSYTHLDVYKRQSSHYLHYNLHDCFMYDTTNFTPSVYKKKGGENYFHSRLSGFNLYLFVCGTSY